MKKFGLFFLSFLMAGILLFSCGEETPSIPTHEEMLTDGWTHEKNGDFYYQILSDEELDEIGLSSQKGNNCKWHDGLGGSLSCDDGTCSVVRVRMLSFSASPSQVCLGCIGSNGVMSTGLCR